VTVMELGALGEFVGAIAVVATLVYLAVQIRQNTRAMEETKRLALAQTYQMRADALAGMLTQAATSDQLGSIIVKLVEAGYPDDLSVFDQLSATELGLFRQWQIAQLTHWDNLFYQYQQGFLDSEYYEDEFKPRVRRLAPVWTALGLGPGRKSFAAEIEKLSQTR